MPWEADGHRMHIVEKNNNNMLVIANTALGIPSI